jgi:hypothetical protein
MKWLLFAFLIGTSFTYAQECSRVWLTGRVKDTLNPNSFLNLMVVNTTSGIGVLGRADGSFGVYVSVNDSIVLSVKRYERIGFRVKGDSLCQMTVLAVVERRPTEIAEVIVKPLKTVQQIKEERESLAMRETITTTGLAGFNSPITALYQRFSKKEQSRAIVAEKEFKDSQEAILQELLKLYVSYDIVKMSPDEFEDFIHFMNMDVDFLKTASDFELVTYIKEKFEHYRELHPAQ